MPSQWIRGVLVWTVGNVMKTVMWTRINWCVFGKTNPYTFESTLVWTGPNFLQEFEENSPFAAYKIALLESKKLIGAEFRNSPARFTSSAILPGFLSTCQIGRHEVKNWWSIDPLHSAWLVNNYSPKWRWIVSNYSPKWRWIYCAFHRQWGE